MLLALVAFFAPPMPEELSQLRRVSSLRLVDREGRLLREQLSSASGVSRWIALEQMAPELVQATVVSEDRRFFLHPGVDPLACLRAAWINARAGRVVEGGSTLTQQLVRSLRGGRPAGWRAKLAEAYWALRVEWRYRKSDILEAYLNRVPYGNQCYGAEAAAQGYFGKPAAQLSLAQAAFLAVLPRAPESFAPYQDLEDIGSFQRQLLERMPGLTAERRQRALAEPIRLQPLDSSFEAGHFCDYVLGWVGEREGGLPPSAVPRQAHPEGERVVTTLDLSLQQQMEDIVKMQVRRLSAQGVDSASVVILEVATGDILAMVGSAGYGQPEIGQFNAATAGRQPGSTLKPFTYGLALERDRTASSLLPDLDLYPQDVAHGFLPRNYDDKFHGPVRLRTALACSYNVPVVRVLERIGVEPLLHRLRDLGFARLTESPAHYGLGLTLGDGEVTLLQLANAYRTLARGGMFSPVRALANQEVGGQTLVMDERVAYLLTDILKDASARAPSFGVVSPLSMPFEVACKTGTSKGFRDNWTVGYTPLYVVAVWVGQSQGNAMNNVSGITGAGPIFRDAMLALEKRSGGSPRFTPPGGLVRRDICEVSGDLPGPYCHQIIQELYLRERQPDQTCSVHRADGLAFPPLYYDWMRGQGLRLPQVAPQASDDPARVRVPDPRGEHEGPFPVRIGYPDQDAVFQIDPVLRRKYQEVQFRAVLPEEAACARWVVDNDVTMVREKPFSLWVPLREGTHRAHVEALDARGRELGASSDLRYTVVKR